MKIWRSSLVSTPGGRVAALCLVVTALVGTLLAGLYSLSGPASEWMAKAPESLTVVRSRLQKLPRMVQSRFRPVECRRPTSTPAWAALRL
jgi:hypothetical protein